VPATRSHEVQTHMVQATATTVIPENATHQVQFYDEPGALAASVARFFAEGLARGEALIVVATAPHREAILQALCAADARCNDRVASGQIVMLDAEATLARFMTPDGPDIVRFNEVIGGTVESALRNAGATRARAYGEMVDLLWREGNLTSALKLEGLWERLLATKPVHLLCGYGMRLLDPRFDADAYSRTCEAHGHVMIAEDRERLETAVDRAMVDVLGGGAESIRPLIGATHHPYGRLGRAEGTILWVRRNLAKQGEAILDRARQYYFQLA